MREGVKKEGMIRIGEVAKAAEVTKSLIHFYIREGLLPRPVKTSPNMGYYDLKCISDIRFIKELQKKKRLPLSAIKLIMHARREGQDQRHVESMSSLLEMIFTPLEVELEVASMTEEELAQATTLPRKDIDTLISMGIVSKTTKPGNQRFSTADTWIIMTFKKLSTYGLRISDLLVYGQYWATVKEEAEAVHAALHDHPERDKLPVDEIYRILGDLKECLSVKAYRQVAQELHEGTGLGPNENVTKKTGSIGQNVIT